MPTFSVVIPTFNRPRMLVAAIQSVMAQSFTDFEILVADDGSSPAASESLEKFSSDRIRVIRNEFRRGAGNARNRGIAAATGRYIALLDDDDRYLSDFLRRTHETLHDSPPSIGFSWCGVRFVSAPTGPSSQLTVREQRFPSRYPTQPELYSDLLNIGTGFGLTFKSECLRRVGPFDETLTCVEDADLFLRLLVAGVQPAVIPEVLVEIHNHAGPRLTGRSMNHQRIAENEWLMERYSGFFERYPALAEQLRDYVSKLKHAAVP